MDITSKTKITRLVIFFSVIITTTFSPLANAAVPTIERDALVALYNSTNGAAWTNNTNWLSGDPCDNDWYGITCASDIASRSVNMQDTLSGNNSIVHINMLGTISSNNNLTGSLPTEISHLSNLLVLKLRYENLNGPIPPEIGNLGNLEELDLSQNDLTGNIPSEFAFLSNLRILNLSYNNLNGGGFLSQIIGLTNLDFIALRECGLTGEIPPNINLLQSLDFLDIGNNNLTGIIPAQVGDIVSLYGLYLDRNNLTGIIPVQIGDLAFLTTLWLQGNQLSGSIPTSLGNLATLMRLNLSSNQLTGEIPASFTFLNDLIHLNLDSNQLAGEIPSNLSNISGLQKLYLNDNNLTGEIPTSFGSLINLLKLDLSSNQLTGVAPPSLTNLTSIIPGEIAVDWNSLHSTDNSLNVFLSNNCFCNWQLNQTKPIGNIESTSASTSINLNWDSIQFLENAGGYKIWMSSDANGAYTQIGDTNNKTVAAFIQQGLNEGQDYYFKIQSYTKPHSNNKNTVVSEFSNVFIKSTSTTLFTSDLAIEIPQVFLSRQILIVIGDPVSYSITTKNHGPDDTTNANLKHNPPAGLSVTSWSCTSSSGGAICPSSGTGALDLLIDLPNNSNLEFTFQAVVAPVEIDGVQYNNGDDINVSLYDSDSFLITASITPDDNVDDSAIGQNISNSNLSEFIFANGFE